MNRSINFNHLGGLYLYQDTLDYMQTGYNSTLDSIASLVGDKVILSGIIEQGSAVTAGWITYNGEILPFAAGLKANNVVIEEVTTNEQFDDGQLRPVYIAKRAKFGNIGGFPFTDLQRLPFGSNIKDALNSIQVLFKRLINVESSVVLTGCDVSEVNTGNSTFKISAGITSFDGIQISTPQYTGTYPVYLTNAGVWASAQPGNSLFVKFDPHTSKRYADVVRRANYRSGDILYSKVLSDRFDINTGVGKWEWEGFKLCAELQGRTPVGLWFSPAGESDIYDPNYKEIGYTTGSNKHRLTRAELPAYSMQSEIIGGNGWPKASGDRSGGNDQYLLSPNAANKNAMRLNVSSLGEDLAHENRQPLVIVAAIERI